MAKIYPHTVWLTLNDAKTDYVLMQGKTKVLGKFPSVESAKAFLRRTYAEKFVESVKPKRRRTTVIPNPVRRKKRKANMSQGITRGTGPTRVFHPIRSAPDYDPSLLRDSEGKKARKQKKQKKRGLKAIAKKRSLKTKLATKRRKAKKAVDLFGARALKKALPTSRRNPPLLDKRFSVGGISVKARSIGHNVFVNFDNGEGWQATPIQLSNWPATVASLKDWLKSEGWVPSAPRSRRKNSSKRKVPAAFRAAAERAKAMTHAQRAAWAKKMQAARKAKRR